MNLGTEIEQKFAQNPNWRKLPYEYAVICIALGLSFQQSYDGFKRRMTPEEIMFEVDEFTPEQIEDWYKII